MTLCYCNSLFCYILLHTNPLCNLWLFLESFIKMAPVSAAQRQRNWHEKLKNEEKYDYKTERILLNCAPSSIHLHPAPPSSFQPPPSSMQHPQQYLHQNIAHNWTISPNLDRKIKLSILTENWHSLYFGGADSESRHRFLKFRPWKSIFGQIWTQKLKVVCLSEN